MKRIIKIASKIVLLLFAALASYDLIGTGLQGPAWLGDGSPEIDPLDLVIGILYLPLFIVLLWLGKSNPKAEKLFWYLGIGIPIVYFVYILFLDALVHSL